MRTDDGEPAGTKVIEKPPDLLLILLSEIHQVSRRTQQGPVQPVPNGEPARPIRVGLGTHGRVVNAVHTRGDKDTIQPTLDLDRDQYVSMVKEDAEQQTNLPHRERKRRDANDNYLSGPPSDRDNHLPGVEA